MSPYWLSTNNDKTHNFSITRKRNEHVQNEFSDGLYILYTCIKTEKNVTCLSPTKEYKRWMENHLSKADGI